MPLINFFAVKPEHAALQWQRALNSCCTLEFRHGRLATMVSLTAYIAVATELVSGTVAAIASKVAYQLKVAGQDGDHGSTSAHPPAAQLQQFLHALRARRPERPPF